MVYLELATSFDTDSSLLAFSRFVSRRFARTEVWSDNGTNLRAGERQLREAVGRFNEDRIPEQLAVKESAGTSRHLRRPTSVACRSA